MVALFNAYLGWLPVIPRVLLGVLLTIFLISVLVNLLIKIIDLIPFV